MYSDQGISPWSPRSGSGRMKFSATVEESVTELKERHPPGLITSVSQGVLTSLALAAAPPPHTMQAGRCELSHASQCIDPCLRLFATTGDNEVST